MVLFVPISCGERYVGQTGTYLNDRQREHHNTKQAVSGHLASHCRDCGCNSQSAKCTELTWNGDPLIKETIESEKITQLDDKYISGPFFLSSKELYPLKK